MTITAAGVFARARTNQGARGTTNRYTVISTFDFMSRTECTLTITEGFCQDSNPRAHIGPV
jgi:hypothetical protein